MSDKEEPKQELRQDRLGGWIILSTGRDKRPHEKKEVSEPIKCPFCPGNEELIPKKGWGGPPNILLEYKIGGDNLWSTRVIPNKFPALRIESEKSDHGAHEIIIETPNHSDIFSKMPIEYFTNMFKAYKTRLTDLYNDPLLNCITIFKNHKKEAGASLEHPHSQLIAMWEIIPTLRLSEKLDRAKEYYMRSNRSIFDRIIEETKESGLCIEENSNFYAFCPYASRANFQVNIFPTKQVANFENHPDEELLQLAKSIKSICERLYITLKDPPFNMILYTGPPARVGDYRNSFRWHLEILPRGTIDGGFEYAGGRIISKSPESAAKILRDAM